jgi:hypothetical protein
MRGNPEKRISTRGKIPRIRMTVEDGSSNELDCVILPRMSGQLDGKEVTL